MYMEDLSILTGLSYVIGKSSNVVRNQGEFAEQILLESSLLSDDFLE